MSGSRRRQRDRRPDPARDAAAAPRPPASSPWHLMAIVVAGVVTYANTFANPFLFDDFGAIVRNTQIRHLWDLRQILVPPAETPVAGRPLAHLSFALNYAIGGLDVFGYHLVNLALHVACGLLLFGLVRRTLLLRQRPGPGSGPAMKGRAANLALAVALLWVVHPLNTEVVTYLSERTESLMACCYLLTLYASLRALEVTSPTAGRRGWLTVAVVACAAGMASKESMVTAPLMVALYDTAFVFGAFGRALRARWRFYAALCATSVLLAGSILTMASISSGGFASAHASPWTYLLNQTLMITRYLRLAVWPVSLVNFYGWARPLELADVWPQATVLVLLAGLAVFAWLRWRSIGFLAVWVFVTLAPSSSVIPIAGEVGAERRMYLPLMGLVTLAVLGMERIVTARRAADDRGADDRAAEPGASRAAAWVAAALVMGTAGALATASLARNREYASALTLAETVLARWPTPNAEQLVGQELMTVGRHEEAMPHFRAASAGYPPARYFLGVELFNAGRPREAISEFQTFIREEPGLPIVRPARLTLARAFAETGQTPLATEQLAIVLAAAPDDADAHAQMADLFVARQDFGDAIPHYRAVLKVRPAEAGAWTGLGVALAATGDKTGAVAAFRSALAAQPSDVHLRVNLARALLDDGDVAGASGEAQRAVAAGDGDPAAHEILGRVFAAQGRFSEARAQFQRALQLDPAYTPAADGLRMIGGRG